MERRNDRHFVLRVLAHSPSPSSPQKYCSSVSWSKRCFPPVQLRVFTEVSKCPLRGLGFVFNKSLSDGEQKQGAMSHNLQSTILVVVQNNSLVSFPFFELSSAVTIMRGGRRNLFGDWRREREKDRGGNCFITRSVTGDGKEGGDLCKMQSCCCHCKLCASVPLH